MEKFNVYKNLIKGAIREGMEEHEPGKKNVKELKGQIFTGEKKGNYKKVVAATQLLLEIAPNMVSEQLKIFLDDQDLSNLPFDPEKYRFAEKVGRGAVSKVHLLESTNSEKPSYVIKLDCLNTGDIDKLLEIAKQQHREYERIKEEYSEIDGFIPNEQTIITTDKKTQEPVITTVQEFVGVERRDLFTEISKDELLVLLEENDEFRKEFLKFTEVTIRLADEKKEIMDFMGNQNLSIVEVDGKPHLRFIDPHNITSTVSEDKDRIRSLEESLEYIKEIRDIIL